MNYAVLIELSRRTISFRYYRDDAGNMFLPFNENEGSMPFAIYCQGNDIQIGQYALAEADKHSMYAWNNVFDAVKQNGTFHYRGQDRNMNELLLVAIKKYLADFFDRILVKTKGTLEANISTMPLVFLFHQDIDRSDRLFVEKSFRDGGFVNLAALDMGCEIVDLLARAKILPAGKRAALTVSSDGVNLIVNAIDTVQKKEMKSFRIIGKGMDPRLKFAVDKLWDSLDFFTYEMNKDNEYGILSEIAATFLASDDVVFQRPVMFSTGVEHECYLDKNQIDGIDLGTDTKIRSDMLNFISQLGFQESEVAIVLYGNIAGGDYFVKNMKAMGSEVVVHKDPGQEKLLRFILDGIIAKGFKVSAAMPDHTREEPLSKPLAPPHSTNANRVLRAAAHMTPQNAQIALLKLESELKKVSPTPSDLQLYLDRINKTMDCVKAQAKQHQGQQKPSVDGNEVKGGEQSNGKKEGSSKQETKTVTLSAADVNQFNAIIMKARSEAPDKAVENLKKLQEHIHVLNPSNMKMWENRLKTELSMAEQRLARMPKPVKTSSKTVHSLTGAKATSKPPVAQAKATRVRPIPRQHAKNLVTGAIGGLKNMANKVKESDLVKAQKLFSDTFRSTFKLSKDEAVRKLEELLEALHKMGIRKFDFQINSRIELLKKK